MRIQSTFLLLERTDTDRPRTSKCLLPHISDTEYSCTSAYRRFCVFFVFFSGCFAVHCLLQHALLLLINRRHRVLLEMIICICRMVFHRGIVTNPS